MHKDNLSTNDKSSVFTVYEVPEQLTFQFPIVCAFCGSSHHPCPCTHDALDGCTGGGFAWNGLVPLSLYTPVSPTLCKAMGNNV